MKNTFIKFNIISVIVLFLLISLGVQNCLASVSGNKALQGLNTANKTTELSDIEVPNLIGKIIGTALAFVGILFFILMIIAGFTWMTARGNEQEVQKAKNTILQASVGLIIVLAAYAITAFLGGGFKGIF